MLDLIIDMIIQLLDFIMLYCISHNVVKRDIDPSFKDIFWGVLYAIIFGITTYHLDNYIYKIFVTIGIFLAIKYITKKKVHDILIIYMSNFLCIAFVQIVVILAMNNLTIKESYWNLLGQIITTIGVLFLNWETPLYKLFDLIEKEILLKLFIYILTSVFFIAAGYFNFDYSNAESYINYFFILVLVSLLGMCRTIKYVFFYTNKMPVQLHDVKNVLLGLHISTQGRVETEKIKDEIHNALTIIGIDAISDAVELDKQNEKVLLFINLKKQKCNKDIIITSDICCYSENDKVPLSSILYMLGVLLDNAIESGTRKEILVKVFIAEESVLISVSNEYERKSTNDFEKMFQSGYSTKSSQSRGYGLPHLSEVVDRLGGEVQLKYKYNAKQKCNYLTLMIIA